MGQEGLRNAVQSGEQADRASRLSARLTLQAMGRLGKLITTKTQACVSGYCRVAGAARLEISLELGIVLGELSAEGDADDPTNTQQADNDSEQPSCARRDSFGCSFTMSAVLGAPLAEKSIAF